MVGNRGPGARVLDVPAEFLEAEAAVGAEKQVDAPVMPVVLDAVEDDPRLVDAGGPLVPATPGCPPIGKRLAPGADRSAD